MSMNARSLLLLRVSECSCGSGAQDVSDLTVCVVGPGCAAALRGGSELGELFAAKHPLLLQRGSKFVELPAL
jgi:hypothetical protein